MITIAPPDLGEIEAVAQSLSPEVTQQMLRGIAESARDYWIRLADRELNTSKGIYKDAIQRVSRRGDEYVISLVGQPAVLIEEGSPQVDMRKWLLGPNVQVKSGQGGKGKTESITYPGEYYRAIPFRHTIPTSGGQAGQQMGKAYEGTLGPKEARKLGNRVYGAARELFVRGRGYTPDGEEDPEGQPYGPGHPLWNDPYRTGQKRLSTKLISIPKLKSHHSTDIYSGMIRTVRSPQDKESGSQYMTFRTISTRKTPSTDPASWIRGATPGKKLAPRVSAFVARMAPKTVQAYVEGIGGR